MSALLAHTREALRELDQSLNRTRRNLHRSRTLLSGERVNWDEPIGNAQPRSQATCANEQAQKPQVHDDLRDADPR